MVKTGSWKEQMAGSISLKKKKQEKKIMNITF